MRGGEGPFNEIFPDKLFACSSAYGFPPSKKNEKSKLLNRPLGISLFFLRLFSGNRRRKRKRQMIGCQNSSLFVCSAKRVRYNTDGFFPEKKDGRGGALFRQPTYFLLPRILVEKRRVPERRKKRLVCLALFCAPYFFFAFTSGS